VGNNKLAEKSSTSPREVLSAEEAAEIAHRAMKGDPDSLAPLRQALEQYPPLLDLGGDLALKAQDKWIELIGGKDNLFSRETIRLRLAKLRGELLGPSPSMIERLLVDRIVLCSLQVHHAELRAANLLEVGCNFQQWKAAQERQESAQRRYLAAIKALAQVRKLLVPVVQVNIAKQQTNVVAAGPIDAANTR
jgi:hypothetical protein